MNSILKEKLALLAQQVDLIDEERKVLLDEIAKVIIDHLSNEEVLDIVVVCTHNSRRSQLGEIWLNIWASYFETTRIHAFSGGMETTAFNERMVEALRRFGFTILQEEGGQNPIYEAMDLGDIRRPMFSKEYDHAVNPKHGYMALMVCDHADENCPMVIGMKYRIPLRYKDPKAYDDTPQESEAYDAKVVEIGREMYYLMEKVTRFV